MFKLFQNTFNASKPVKPQPLLRGQVAFYSLNTNQNENNKETTDISENALEAAPALKL